MLHIDVAIGIPEINGSILFVRRAKHPYRGLLLLPGGKQEGGETFDETLVREMMEETGLPVKNVQQVAYVEGVTDTANVPPFSHRVVYFRFDVAHTDYRPGDEEIVLVPLAEVFHRAKEIIPIDALILKEVYINKTRPAYRVKIKEEGAGEYRFSSCDPIAYPHLCQNEALSNR